MSLCVFCAYSAWSNFNQYNALSLYLVIVIVFIIAAVCDSAFESTYNDVIPTGAEVLTARQGEWIHSGCCGRCDGSAPIAEPRYQLTHYVGLTFCLSGAALP